MKYLVLKAVEEKGWKVGDIVQVIGKYVGDETLTPYLGDEPNKHVLVVVEPATLSGKVKI